MKNKTLSTCLAAFMLVLATAIQAQIKGTVLEDATGEPIIGASVLQVGTTNGVITDFDGNFELNAPEGADLLFSYMGFQSQTLPAQKKMIVRLKEDAFEIQEVVAIGYGSQKKKEVTGSVASVKAEDFNAGVKSNPVGLLQGKVAGLNIINTTSDPTQGGYSIQIRGFSTLDKGAGTSPLYIVDGVPVSSIDNIAPDEIASMDVLKDGSAAAIYGTRGTNGVILITTKRGEGFSDQPVTNIEYSGYVSTAWVNSKTGMATPQQFVDLANLTDGKVMPTIYKNADGSTNYTDWMAELTRKAAITHSHTVAITGSHKKFNYRASLLFKNAEGIAKNNNRQEVLAKLAAQQKALDGWLDLQYDFSYMHYRNDYFCGDFTQAAIANPTYPIYDETTASGYFAPQGSGQSNAVEAMNQKESYQDGNYFRGSIKATVNIKAVEGLKISGFAAIEEGDNRNYWSNKVINTDATGSGKAGRSNSMNLSQLYEATIDYAHSWGGHSLVGVAGFSYQNFLYDGSDMSNNDFPTESMKFYQMGNGEVNKKFMNISSYRNSNTLAAAFLRMNYNYNEKYLLSASVRYEGSSRFGPNHKWGWFPAVSAGWRIKGEEFMQDQDWCNELKLRAGFGITGNNLGSDLRSVAMLSNGGTFWYNGKWTNTYVVSQNVNPDLRWERKFEYNFGVDFSFLENRLYGSLDLYLRDTKDLLWEYEVPTPPYQYPTLLANAGQMRSYGVELVLSGVPVKTKDWTWTTTPTIAFNRNYITKLSDPEKGFNYTQTTSGGVGENGIQNTNTQILVEGQPVGAFYGYSFAGFKSDGTWMYNTPTGGYTSDPNEGHRQIIGSAQPAITFGWNNTVKWRDLDITLFFRGVAGNKILNVTRWAYGPQASQSMNVFMYDITHNPNNNPNGVTYTNKAAFSDYYLEDGSYLKLDNITIGYTFRFKENKYIQSLRLYGTAQNLFTITGYSGQDPEVNTTSVWDPGIDYTSFYPRTGSFMFGLNLNLL
ncbi:MAG: SusC/RagA family TonB-linked outer membrane protein [Paludibacteraceae bacterium]|nr:SusC/RagA family TonB-linked outer membrane protein [Paludibacteraceae bacterium]